MTTIQTQESEMDENANAGCVIWVPSGNEEARIDAIAAPDGDRQ